MPGLERADSLKINLSPNNRFGLTLLGNGKNRNLFIEQPPDFDTGTPEPAKDLLRTVMLAHLIARHFPGKIETNFKLGHTDFLNELYSHYGYKPPRIKASKERIKSKDIAPEMGEKPKADYANAHSGGLDSVYRAAKFRSEGKSVFISHLRNLNPKNNFREAAASRMQADILNFPYEEIKLRNGTDNTGFAGMSTRDMFLALATAVGAEKYNVSKVFIEGDMQTDPKAHFSEYAPAWTFFNRLIKEAGLSATIDWIDAHDIETIGEVIKLEKSLGIDILSSVQNCFTAPYQIGNSRKKWERETPEIAKNSPNHWCGSCLKCRRMTLGRLFYHDTHFNRVDKTEAEYFLADTRRWIDIYKHNSGLVSQSFLSHLSALRGAR